MGHLICYLAITRTSSDIKTQPFNLKTLISQNLSTVSVRLPKVAAESFELHYVSVCRHLEKGVSKRVSIR